MVPAISHAPNGTHSNKLTLVDPTCYRSVRCTHGPAGPVWANCGQSKSPKGEFDLVRIIPDNRVSFVVSRTSCFDFIEEAYVPTLFGIRSHGEHKNTRLDRQSKIAFGDV